MATVTTNNQYYTDIANAIRGKNGTETQYKPSEMAAAIQAISGGGEPEPPDDGKTRLYITVPANAMEGLPPPRNQMPLYIQQTVVNGVTIDWGDGTAPETLPVLGAVNTTHTYEQAGDYIISLDPAEGCELGFGDGFSNTIIGRSFPYASFIKKIYMGKNVFDVGAGAFANNSAFKIFISQSVSIIGEHAFAQSRALSSIAIPGSVSTIKQSAFDECTGILNLNFAEGITDIGDSAFSTCVALSSVVIPNSVTTIEDYAFGSCMGMKEYHFLSQTPPSLSGSHVFNQIPSDCIIYVPVGSLQAYQTATNWTTYADQMQEEPA